MAVRNRLTGRESPEEEEEEEEEPEVEIHLCTNSVIDKTRIGYDFKTSVYQPFIPSDLLIHLLTLPSKIISKEDLELKALQEAKKEEEAAEEQEGKDSEQDRFYLLHQELKRQKEEEQRKKEEQELFHQQDYDVSRDLEDLYGNVMSPEELAKLDSQPNPFNFSERVSQTLRVPRKELAMQTDQPPSNTYKLTVGLSIISDAYDRDYELKLAREKQKLLEKQKEEEENEKKAGDKVPAGPPDPVVLVPAVPQGEAGEGLGSLIYTSRLLERTVHQNTYDDVIQDYKYWEDTSDDYRPMEGSLLPLWKLSAPRTRDMLVSDVCWSPIHPDLLAATYCPGPGKGAVTGGMLCIFSLKSPGVPERCLPSPCGLTSLQFHPTRECVVVAGRSDGAVMVYDAHAAQAPRVLISTTTMGKHLLPVTQVRWVSTSIGQHLMFYSVSEDGRVTEWTVLHSSLAPHDVLTFRTDGPSKRYLPVSQRHTPEGSATCLAIKPDDKSVLLVGADTGLVVEICMSSSSHKLVRYPAHTAAVRGVVWNNHHTSVFATCSMDWMFKIWLRHQESPLVEVDLGSPVAGVRWSPFSSSVVVAVTEDGRGHVYDLYLRKCRPLCSQTLPQRRASVLACLDMCPFHPVLVVGGDRGYLVTFKLSPNLRRPPKEAKGADEQKLREIELAKIERLITTAKP